MQGNTIKTIRYFFSQQGIMTDDFDLVIQDEVPEETAMMRELDFYDDRHVVFRVVSKITID